VALDASRILQAGTFLGGPNPDTVGNRGPRSDGSLYFLPVLAGPVQHGNAGFERSASSSARTLPKRLRCAPQPRLDKLFSAPIFRTPQQATAQLFPDGSVYYAGTACRDFAQRPSLPNANAGGYDGILARLDPTGSNLLFPHIFGRPEHGLDFKTIAVAPDGSIWRGVELIHGVLR